MFAKGRPPGPILALCVGAIGCAPGCLSAGPCPPTALPSAMAPLPGPVVVDSPRGDDPGPIAPISAVETWVVHTRACEQTIGSNPWPGLIAARPDPSGGPLRGTDPEGLLALMGSRRAVILVHGNGYTYRRSLGEALEVRGQLEAIGGLTPESLFVVFDWPSEKLLRGLAPDLNEKARRSQVAGYHLARFLQAAPAGSEMTLMGQSDGGRIVLTALHLLSGAELPKFLHEDAARLTSGRPDLRIRGVTLEAAAEHDWLDPGERLGGALPAAEALLNLYNTRDYALAVYTLGEYTGTRAALGRVGLTRRDLNRLGPLADRVEQIPLHPLSGRDHTLFTQALTYPGVADRIADYTSGGDFRRAATRVR